jgi:hypothetical protein
LRNNVTKYCIQNTIKYHCGKLERVLGRDFGRIPIRFQTNGPNISSKANTGKKFYTHDIDLLLLFIDFKKVFDSINQKKALGISNEFWDTQEDKTTNENDIRRSTSHSNRRWENKQPFCHKQSV